jgi:hypothetical protein
MTLHKNPAQSKTVLLIVIILFCATVAILLTRLHDYHSSDFGYYWVASRLLLEGGDPYQTSQWLPIAKEYGTDVDLVISFPYPLPMILLFLPLSAIALPIAAVIWLFLITAMILTSMVILLIPQKNIKQINVVIPLLIGILLFRPLITIFYWGQMTSLVFFILTLSAYLISNGKWKIGTAILTFLLIKPQIGVPILGLFALWSMLRRHWEAILVEVISIFVFLIPAFIYNPNWVKNWLSSGGNSLEIVFGNAPTLWGLGMLLCQGQHVCGLSLSLMLSISVLAIGIYLIIRFREEDTFLIFGIMVTTVLLITPYLLTNDLIAILIPFLVIVQRLQKLGYPYLLISTSTILLSLITIALVPIVQRLQSDAPTSVISIISLILLVLILFRPKITSLTSTQDLSQNDIDK